MYSKLVLPDLWYALVRGISTIKWHPTLSCMQYEGGRPNQIGMTHGRFGELTMVILIIMHVLFVCVPREQIHTI